MTLKRIIEVNQEIKFALSRLIYLGEQIVEVPHKLPGPGRLTELIDEFSSTWNSYVNCMQYLAENGATEVYVAKQTVDRAHVTAMCVEQVIRDMSLYCRASLN